MEKQIITVKGMSCGHCEMAVKNAVMELEGVKKARASYKKGQVVVKFDAELVSPEQIKAAIVQTGYEA